MPTFNHIYNLEDANLPWQKLESILSAYMDLVDAEKVFALNASLGYEMRYNTTPWTLMPYTTRDLRVCLDLWRRLYQAIERRAGVEPSDDPDLHEPVCGRSSLSAACIPKGFAWDLFSHARIPAIRYVAPGIRLPTPMEFIDQPFKDIAEKYPEETAHIKMPILFFHIEGTVSAKDAKFRFPFSTVERVPCGLYLDALPEAANSFEDSCRLLLPFRLGDNKYARMSDGKIIAKTHIDLYGHGISPFVMRHGPKLNAILENWLDNVESHHWAVDGEGVAGGIETFKLADTREFWWRYRIPEIRSI